MAITCWLCGDELHQVADHRLDDFVWVDATGMRYGDDADLRHLPGGPDARLVWLRNQMNRATNAQRGKRAEHTWLYWARAREYTALLVRLNSGTWHTHQVRASELPPWDGPPVPEHCGWPMWLRPSGWHCRQGCGTILAEVAG
jgi:hypothetical protein